MSLRLEKNPLAGFSALQDSWGFARPGWFPKAQAALPPSFGCHSPQVELRARALPPWWLPGVGVTELQLYLEPCPLKSRWRQPLSQDSAGAGAGGEAPAAIECGGGAALCTSLAVQGLLPLPEATLPLTPVHLGSQRQSRSDGP